MTTFTLTTLPQWVSKVKKVADAVVSQAASDLLAGIEVRGGIARTGNRVPGAVPVDTGFLANSLQSTLYGSSSISSAGQNGWIMVAGSMKAGDTARFAWTADYARLVHDGARGVPGTHWVDAAANRWPAVVAGAVAKARAEIGG